MLYSRAICAILQLTHAQYTEISLRVDLLANAISSAQTLSNLSGTVQTGVASLSNGFTSLASLWS